MEPEFLPAAEFLPKLPKSNLDDRDFDDLVEECLLRIPRYCPEWTNYNPGDPGVTLVELFAWLVHQMLYRFNQVPRRHYVTFLELLGIRLLPPTPARTELTFYLTRAQSQCIRAGTEVATVRTVNQEAIIFTTDRELVIGQPQIKHVLMSNRVMATPTRETLTNRFEASSYERERQWEALEIAVGLFRPCQPESCFYLVFDANQGETNAASPASGSLSGIEGNVLALTFKGPAAVTTGINPDNPPLRWEAWTGDGWQPGILRQRTDDRTKGFSFDRLGEGSPNPEQEGADVILHLPQRWPVAEFGRYQGHWIRCVYVEPDREQQQFEYQRSPEMTGLSVHSIGGAVGASECTLVQEELLGTSNGKPGQVFELEGKPILQRDEEEHIKLRLPDGQEESWTEVPHFGDSDADDPHYLIDSQTGLVQFGPLIREPYQLRERTRMRGQVQSWGRFLRRRQTLSNQTTASEDAIPAVLEAADRHQERQYGKVPPLGAEIIMTRYRVGGGSRGNVQAGKLSVLKTAIPYVRQVINYGAAEGGTDAESLDEAVMRVPAILRTRETALTPEDFEQIARRFQSQQGQTIHRAHCVTASHLASPGVVNLIAIPLPQNDGYGEAARGLHPDGLELTSALMQGLQNHLDTHKALGIRVKLDGPEYVGVKVQAQVLLHPQYANPDDQSMVAEALCARLYRFINPITGGFDGNGWPLGRPVRSSDIISLLQTAPEVHYVGGVRLSSLRRYGRDHEVQWIMSPEPEQVPLGELAVACSWADLDGLDTGHDIEFLRP